MRLTLLPDSYAVCRLDPDASLPEWAKGQFVSITRTLQELSVVCPEQHVPENSRHEGSWKIFEVEGPMDLSLVGVLASLTHPLAKANINLFAMSTFDTDYLLVKEERLEDAKDALLLAGHSVTL
jgi:uncharacterized protein